MSHMPTNGTSNSERRRIVVAMSGGVDSSVAAALLIDQGHEVIGMMMRLWSEPGSGADAPTNRCCTPDQMADARRVADRLDIPFYAVDVRQHFRQAIVQFFLDEHEAGRTPNPCVECNRQIRFTWLLERAMALEADYLVTGHYARVDQANGKYRLLQGIDSYKDQSYVLHTLRQDQLAQVFFPIGEYTKPEVRELARHYGLSVASKRESQDLCFLKDGDYRRFLRENSVQVHIPGPILNENDHELGRHDGLAFYTIGQRKGLGIAAAEPLFVLRKDPARNALIVGPREALGIRELTATGVNWISGEVPTGPISAQVKIRYKAVGIEATVWPLGADQVRVEFTEPVFGVTPGQAAVFYHGEVCLGGGLIVDEQAHMPAETRLVKEVAL
ncbi:MAG: tRNA 2-thiouridine(34) synthase MnmA [Candidatus Promineofilum sp.]|nr:tRNA 2-thiouridine(34) synthase MnmA [Promineifilum sp.]